MPKIALVYNLKKSKTEAEPLDYFSEFDSIQTIESIAGALRLGGHQVSLVEADRNFPDWIRTNKVDMVFNVAEGSFGGSSREAQVPAILDFLKVPYTGSGVLASALSMDKAMAKQIFTQQGIPTPNSQLFTSNKEQLKESFYFPLIVKPNCEGSAKGIHASSVVNSQSRLHEEVDRIIKKYNQNVLVEEFIEGREVTVGILGNQKPQILPILEIDFSKCHDKGETFYSWEVKEYQGIDPLYPDPEFFCPARLKDSEAKGIRKVALAAYRALGCLDISRVDIRLSSDSIPYVLEVNSLPGLDPLESNITRCLGACGMKYEQLINIILDSALTRYGLVDKIKRETAKGG